VSMKYDLENLLEDVETVLKTNLNNKITALNTEKSDTIVLRSVPAQAYFFETLDQRVANYNPFILYGIEEIETVSTLGDSAQQVTISVVLVLSDPQDKNPIPKRMLRYSRALKETIEENFALSSNAINLSVQSLVPVPFALQNNTQLFRAVGIKILATLA
jgi:hypothetical protein